MSQVSEIGGAPSAGEVDAEVPSAQPSPRARKTSGQSKRVGRRPKALDSGPTRLAEANDVELLRGIQRASEPHFASLYDRYFPRIYRYVKRRLKGDGDAEEIVQEVFLAVFSSLKGYRGEASLVAWIYGIAKNTLNASWRKTALQRTRAESADAFSLQAKPGLADCTPEEQLVLQQYIRRMREEVDGLSDWQGEVFAMRHLENLSISEISRRTKRTSESVRSSLYRMKKLFFETADVRRGGDQRASKAAEASAVESDSSRARSTRS